MRAPSNEFQPYLAPDESLIDAGSGALVTDAYRREGSIGVTDRRLLFVSEDGEYVDVTRAGISWIRSQPRTSVSARSLRCRGLAVGGALVALVGFLAAAALTGSVLGAALVLGSVGGFVLAESVRRTGVEAIRNAVARVERRLPDGLDRPDWLADADRVRQRAVGRATDDRQLVVLGICCLALGALIGPVALAGSLAVVPLTLVTLCGLAAAEYAARRERELKDVGGTRRHEREVDIHLVGGNTVRLRVDSAERIDHALSRVLGGRRNELPDPASRRA
ncbi:hypothetical protein [Halorarum halobium]|uniref:hypothetical protein n=1 Tax=Halorarum halobium TaxID=3075121 RepID=UPI0028AA7B8F|nr:hypothetical protein [Halobaculum sp. XH14]